LEKATIFEFSTQHLLKKDKIRFHYALKGRDGKSGVKQLYNITTLGRAVLLVPEENKDNVKAFLNQWKCKIKQIPIILR